MGSRVSPPIAQCVPRRIFVDLRRTAGASTAGARCWLREKSFDSDAEWYNSINYGPPYGAQIFARTVRPYRQCVGIVRYDWEMAAQRREGSRPCRSAALM